MHLLRLVVEHTLEFLHILARLGRDKHAIVVHTRHPCVFEFFERNVLAQAWGEVVGVFLHIRELVDFVKHHNHLLVASATHFLKGLVHHLHLFLKLRVGNVHHMHHNVAVAHLIEGGLERIHQVVGQFADKTHGVGEQEWQILNHHLTHGGVEGGKKFVFGKHIALAQQVHKRGFTHVGIAHEGDTSEFATVFALNHLLLVPVGKFLLEQRNFGLDDTAVGLNLGFTRTTHTDTTTLTLQVGPHTGKAWQQILVLRQFHLHLGVGGLRTACENIENQAGAVEHLHLGFLLNVCDLLWRKVVVENHQVHLVLIHIVLDFSQFALTHV